MKLVMEQQPLQFWPVNCLEKLKSWLCKEFTLNTLLQDGERPPNVPEKNWTEFVNINKFLAESHEDEEFKMDLLNIARTTLSSKLLT